MTNRRLPVGAALFLVIGTARAAALSAQETAPLILRLPASPRAFGFGDAYQGGAGSDAVFYNPAQIGRRNGLAAAVARYRDASTQGSLASSTSLGRLNVAIFGQWLDYAADQFPARPGALTVRGAGNGQSLAAGAALATLVKGVRLGIATKYLEERTPSARSAVTGFDIGVSRDVSRLTIGLVAQHLGPDLDLGGSKLGLPTRIVLGATTRRLLVGTFFDLTASAAVARERGGRIAPAGGVELLYEPVAGWTAAARLGLRRVDQRGDPGLRPLTLGASFGLDRFSLDYGFEAYRGVGAVHRFGVRIE